jgi:DnaD/phage-associated family protein
MKKTYISVKCGLSRDPKHRQTMGECIWLFLHMIDITDWDSGIVHDWKDEAAAEDMGMPVRTLREQRRKLDELGYITCRQKQYTQDIVIHNWTNPREYSGEVRNKKNQGDSLMEPQKTEQDYSQDDTQGYIQGNRQNVTPTSNSTNQLTKESKEEERNPLFSFYENKIGALTPLMADAIEKAEKNYTAKWITDAIELASEKGARHWNYCEAVLKRWKQEGRADKRPGKKVRAADSEDPNKYVNSQYADYLA